MAAKQKFLIILANIPLIMLVGAFFWIESAREDLRQQREIAESTRIAQVATHQAEIEINSQKPPTPQATKCLPTLKMPISNIVFSSESLDVTLEYPEDWVKKETEQFVIFSPSEKGVNLEDLADYSMWIGKAKNRDTAQILISNMKEAVVYDEGISNFVGQEWQTTQIVFHDEKLCGKAIAHLGMTTVAEQDYYYVIVTPLMLWNEVQPIYKSVLDTLKFEG